MTLVHDPVRLRALLGTEAWAWWRRRVRAELEAGRPIPAVITCQDPTEEEREAANRLLGTPGAAGPVRAPSDEIETLLREAGIAEDLASCVTALDGPLMDRVAERASHAAAWNAVHRAAERAWSPVCSSQAVQDLIQSGLLRRLSANQPDDARCLAEQASSVMARLPSARPIHLAELAAVCLGDAHALDRDRALGRLVLRLKGPAVDEGVLGWRSAWRSLGIRVDEVSASTLVLNLPALGRARLSRVCAEMLGEPLRLTTRQIEREETAFDVKGRTVFVCENPTVVVVAADALGDSCPPMVCVDGRATSPSLLLLRRLAGDGAALRYQGDGDWPGLSIAADLRRHVDLQPWRLTSGEVPLMDERPGPALEGSRVETPWDPPLADALARRGRALHEETVLDLLLNDLRGAVAEKGP